MMLAGIGGGKDVAPRELIVLGDAEVDPEQRPNKGRNT
jgi:hypothetical protein